MDNVNHELADNRDLDAIYAMDKDFHTESVGRAKFTGRYFKRTDVRYMGIMEKVSKPFRRLIAAKMLPNEKDRELTVRCFVRTVFDGVPNAFENVRWKGQDIVYSEDAAVSLFLEADELYVDLAQRFSDRDAFKGDAEEAVKN